MARVRAHPQVSHVADVESVDADVGGVVDTVVSSYLLQTAIDVGRCLAGVVRIDVLA